MVISTICKVTNTYNFNIKGTFKNLIHNNCYLPHGVKSLNRADVIGLNELLESMRRLQKLPDETRLQRIVEVLDTDQDGQIDINDALRVSLCSRPITAFDTDGGPVVRDPQKSCRTTRTFKPSGPMDHRNFQL